MHTNSTLEPYFKPKGVAIIGASHDPKKLGYGLARNLVQSGYQGIVHFVNIKGGMLLGKHVYTSVLDIPDPVDLAVILIPPSFVPDVLQACGKRGIHAAIIGTGGFRETSAEGALLEKEIKQIGKEYAIRLVGPNCIGILDTHAPIDTTFLPPPGPTPGDVAFISHSGAICASVIDWARGQGFGLSRLVSLGNQVDVNETDMLEPVAEDPYTNVLTLYLEGIREGRRFVNTARKVVQHKPIVALKVGRLKSGRKAVASHTGALAGQEHAYNAAFLRAGVLRAKTSEEMFDWARALAWCPPAKGRNVAVITNAGGPGVTAADALEDLNLHLSEFKSSTIDALKQILPPAASLNNPIDLLASASPDQFADCLRVVLNDPMVDSAMVIFPTPPMYTAGAVAKSIIPIIHNSNKPVVVAVMGERMIQEAVELLRAARVPEYRFPERAAAALPALTERMERLVNAQAEPVTFEDIKKKTVQENLNNWGKNGFLPQQLSNKVLAAYGIPVLPMTIAKSAEDAAEKASKMGFPVALKIASPNIPHKSDVGGVLLNLRDQESVRHGYSKIMGRIRKENLDANIEGISIQQMINTGQEVIVGGIQDAQFGGLVMFGSGGVEVEGLKDVAFALAPLTHIEAEHMLKHTWAGKKISGYRDIPAGDQDALLNVLFRLAQLIADFHQIMEVEINPLRVLSKGNGVVAIDVRIRVDFNTVKEVYNIFTE
ncbi:MAG: acetate--CoA ligase family protein [Anaerolineales bacterium]|nr:acetate--CoA ligase family protein [Anaerolineales bacterium]